MWAISHASIILALISGLLVSSDLIISKGTADKINKWLRYELRPFDSIRKTFVVGAIVAVVGMAAWVTFLMVRDTTGSTLNLGLPEIVWLPVLAGGFILGMVLQWFLVHGFLLLNKPPSHFQDRASTFSSLLDFRVSEASAKVIIQNRSIDLSSLVLGVLAIIFFIKAIKSPYLMPLSLGLFWGVVTLEFSIYLTKFLRWFLTTDPNPDTGRNPRVLARIGLLFFIIAGIIDLLR